MTAWDTTWLPLETDFLARESGLGTFLEQLDGWLSDPVNIHDALAEVEDHLVESRCEEDMQAQGELALLARVSGRVARLRDLIDRRSSEGRAEAWRDLAGCAVQALVMLKLPKNAPAPQVFETRKNRLIRGFCPDCGRGVLLRSSFWDNRLSCSERCGFSTGDLYRMHLSYPDFNAMLSALAGQPAFSEQA